MPHNHKSETAKFSLNSQLHSIGIKKICKTTLSPTVSVMFTFFIILKNKVYISAYVIGDQDTNQMNSELDPWEASKVSN
jgi:hypothetical protein